MKSPNRGASRSQKKKKKINTKTNSLENKKISDTQEIFLKRMTGLDEDKQKDLLELYSTVLEELKS